MTVVTGLAACQSGPAGSSGPGGSSGPSPDAGVVGTAAPSLDPSAEGRLSIALEPLRAASEFDSQVTADGAIATELSGRTVGDATTLTVTTNGRAVEYIRIPPTAWAREPGGTWVVIDAAQAPSSPLAALAEPTTLTPVGADGAMMLATYPAAAFGLQGDPVTVSIDIAGATVTFTYSQTTKGHAVVSTTVIRPATDTTPIINPTG